MNIINTGLIFIVLSAFLVIYIHDSVPVAKKTPITAYFEPYECLGADTWPNCVETKKRNPALKQKGEK